MGREERRMTQEEKIIVSAYTGVLMCDFDDLHEYIQKKFGRPVFTHELADKGIQKEIKEMSKEEFLEICNREEPEWKKGKWIRIGRTNIYGGYELECSICGDKVMVQNIERELYCRNCGARMKGTDDETD